MWISSPLPRERWLAIFLHSRYKSLQRRNRMAPPENTWSCPCEVLLYGPPEERHLRSRANDLADPLRIEGPAIGVHNGNLSLSLRRPEAKHMTDMFRHYCQIWSRGDLTLLVEGGNSRILATRLSYPGHQVSPQQWSCRAKLTP